MQETFQTIYRNRNTFLHHVSYMRTRKALAFKYALDELGIDARETTVFDYGFGPGNILEILPNSCRVYGCEIDEINVVNVQKSLKNMRGFQNVDLSCINLKEPPEIPIIHERVDIFVLSHVLEHIKEPVEFLARIANSANIKGCILVGIVPINEIRPDPNHYWKIEDGLIDAWAKASGWKVVFEEDLDEIGYLEFLLQDRINVFNSFVRKVCRLLLGIMVLPLSEQRWRLVSKVVGKLGLRTTQKVFVLKINE